MKLLFATLSALFLATSAMAQEKGLFPELDGQFKLPEKQSQHDAFDDYLIPDEPADDAEDGQEDSENTVIKIQLQDLKGALPYARTLAYCSGTAVLTNETKQPLKSLSLTLTYKDMPAELSYSGVQPGKSQSQSLMLIGPPCESILNMPEIDIKTCQWGSQSEDNCKKRVQFLPPQPK